MKIVYGFMMLFLVIGFVDALCNSVSSTRQKEERQTDLLIATAFFGMIIVMTRTVF